MRVLVVSILALVSLSACQTGEFNPENVDISPLQSMVDYQSSQSDRQQIEFERSQSTKQTDRQCMSDCLILGYKRGLCESRCEY